MSLKSYKERGTVIALGNFDGLHLGHQAVINMAVKKSEKLNAAPCILMFLEHTLWALKGDAPPELFAGEVKERVFDETGADIYRIDFNTVKDLTPREFFDEILIGRFNAKGICCGFNYRFGKGAKGNAQMLKEFCDEAGIEIAIIDEEDYKGSAISSTRIREAIQNGEIEDANMMLGRIFSYKTVVVDGDKRGRLLGSPTINQFFQKGFIVPKHGVYSSITYIDGKEYASVTNIGNRPTIGTDIMGSETYILDFSGNLYGKEIEVGLLKFLRPEMKFNDLQQLSDQIKKDAEQSQEIFNNKFQNSVNNKV